MVLLRVRGRRQQGGSKPQKQKRQHGEIPLQIRAAHCRLHPVHKYAGTKFPIPDPDEQQPAAGIKDQCKEYTCTGKLGGSRVFHDQIHRAK